MYLLKKLFYFILLVLSFSKQLSADCGCKLNRDATCNSDVEQEKPSEKYSKESNIQDNNNNNKQTNAFNTENMVLIPGGLFEMGTNEPVFKTDFESPIRNVSVKSFYMDKYEVSNRDFKEFVEKTGYKTEAEVFGDSFVFEMTLPEEERNKYDEVKAVQAPWWIKLPGASWEHPEGINSSIEGIYFVCYIKNIEC